LIPTDVGITSASHAVSKGRPIYRRNRFISSQDRKALVLVSKDLITVLSLLKQPDKQKSTRRFRPQSGIMVYHIVMLSRKKMPEVDDSLT
jgi:hypothetical protein